VSPTETTDPAKTKTDQRASNQKDIKREISVEIPAAEVSRETELQIQRYQKSARIPGFRTGHVPPSIIRQRFGDGLKNDVIEALVPKYFRREAEKQGLIPVSQPRVTDLHMHDGESLRFKASFEVLPEVQVEGYKELRADKPEIAVTDEEVEQALTREREQHATYTTVEGRPLAEGDFAQASMDGKPKDGKDVEAASANPVHMDDVLIEIGGKNTVAEFSQNLTGASAGEERTFDVSYPEDISDKRLAGKTFVYTVKVNGIKQKSLPELNDDFAKELGEFSSLDQVRKQIRENTFSFLEKKGISFVPSQGNFFMMEVKGFTGQQVNTAMATHKVMIGRIWQEWPQMVRVTVGTYEEMGKFNAALDLVMKEGPPKAG